MTDSNMSIKQWHDEQNEGDPTLQYYEDHAEEFAANTIGADMKDIRSRFLSHLPERACILDFGCGTGRDAKSFRDLGYDVAAVDGSEALCRMARNYAGVPVECLDFREFTTSGDIYDGIWACASLLHLKKQDLFSVLKELGRALKPEGVLYTSFKYGDYEGERNGRYFTDFTLEGFETFIKDLPELRILEHWVSEDVRPGRGSERWLNMILGKTKASL